MRTLLTFAIVAAAALGFAAPAGATIVNLDGHANASTDGSTAASLSLGAGTWEVTFTQDDFTSFSRWSSQSGCDASGLHCRTGWENSAVIALGSIAGPTVFWFGDGGANGGLGPITGEDGYFASAAQSIAHAGMYSQTFTLSALTNVYFYIYDDILSDNRGGISLSITPVAVPEPAGWPLLIAGVGVAGLLAARRRRAVPRNAS